MNAAILPRVLPFILFMSFIGVEELMRLLTSKGLIVVTDLCIYYLYPVKAIAVALVLFFLHGCYSEIDLKQILVRRHLFVSTNCGVAVFLLWISVDFYFNPLGNSQGFNPLLFENQSVRTFMIISRIAGAVLVVPLMEELFWRSFFMRYVIRKDFSAVPVGTFSWSSFLITAVLFGLEHNLIIAGIIAGISYNLLLYYTRSITHCIFAHALTNLLLGIYVLGTHQWYYW